MKLPEFWSFYPFSPLLLFLLHASNPLKTLMKFYLAFNYSWEKPFPIYLFQENDKITTNIEISSVFNWISMWTQLLIFTMMIPTSWIIPTWTIKDKEYCNFLFGDSLTADEVSNPGQFSFDIFPRTMFCDCASTITTWLPFRLKRSRPSPTLKASSSSWWTRLSTWRGVPSSGVSTT